MPTGDSGGHRGRAYVGHLHDLLACLQQGSAYLCEAIEAQTPDGLCLILCATPTPDDDREGREPGPQPFTEIARPGKASRGAQAQYRPGPAWSALPARALQQRVRSLYAP